MTTYAPSESLFSGSPPPGISDRPLIVNACLTGNIASKASNPHAPLSVSEIVDDALATLAAGAAILHIHARDEGGQPTWRPEVFARIFEGVRHSRPDAILVATTSGRHHSLVEQRSAVLELDGAAKPDMASLSLGSMNFPRTASMNSPDTIIALCTRMRERGITPELEAFELGMLNFAFHLQRRGLLPETCYVNLMLGSLGTIPGRVGDLVSLVREIPGHWHWAGAGIGRYQLPINAAAVAMGGHVRVGLEDNPFINFRNRVFGSNPGLVRRIVGIARELDRPVASCADARAMLRLGQASNWETMQTVIRKMTPDDLSDALSILAKWNLAPVKAIPGSPKPERDHLEIANSFVAIRNGSLVGVASWLEINDTHAETASLAIHPDVLGCGIGQRLQEARIEEMRRLGIRHVRTEADRPEVIHWYLTRFGYRITGTTRKRHPFGDPDRDSWTVLECDI